MNRYRVLIVSLLVLMVGCGGSTPARQAVTGSADQADSVVTTVAVEELALALADFCAGVLVADPVPNFDTGSEESLAKTQEFWLEVESAIAAGAISDSLKPQIRKYVNIRAEQWRLSNSGDKDAALAYTMEVYGPAGSAFNDYIIATDEACGRR